MYFEFEGQAGSIWVWLVRGLWGAKIGAEEPERGAGVANREGAGTGKPSLLGGGWARGARKGTAFPQTLATVGWSSGALLAPQGTCGAWPWGPRHPGG